MVFVSLKPLQNSHMLHGTGMFAYVYRKIWQEMCVHIPIPWSIRGKYECQTSNDKEPGCLGYISYIREIPHSYMMLNVDYDN